MNTEKRNPIVIKKHWIFLCIGIIIGMLISISINHYKNQRSSAFLKVESNLDGFKEYPYLDMDELTKYTDDEVIDALYNELLQRIKDGVVGGMLIGYDEDLCRALIDKCQTRGVNLLLKLYQQYKGDGVRRVIVESLADRQRIETVPIIIEGIKGEIEYWILSDIDESLSQMTTENPYYNHKPPDTSNKDEWKKLYRYWSEYLSKNK